MPLFNRLPEGEGHFRNILSRYKSQAKVRKLEWDLSIDLARELMKSDCAYCGQPPVQLDKTNRKYNGLFPYNGIDRVDNSKGYTEENCVPCCRKCNIAKNNYSVEEFLMWIKRVYEYNFGEG